MHPVTKALGLKWNTRTDSIVFMIELDSEIEIRDIVH